MSLHGESEPKEKRMFVMSKDQSVLTEKEAAKYIRMSRSFLRQSRMDHGKKGRLIKSNGPAFLKIGKSVRYLRSDLDKWLLSLRVE